MNISFKEPAEVLNKAYLKDKPTQSQFDNFLLELQKLLNGIDAAHGNKQNEEHQKSLLQDFFNRIGYQGQYDVKPESYKGQIGADLTIRKGAAKHTRNLQAHPTGVIIETKKPQSSEMPTRMAPNAKALQEALFYLLYETYGKSRTHRGYVKNIIITDFHTWMLIRTEHLKAFLDKMKRSFEDWEAGERSSKRTDFMYQEIEKELPKLYPQDAAESLQVAYFDLKEICALLEDPNNPDNRDQLIALYVLLSPRYLLQLPPANDSNELNKGFYEELLYIIGLHEVERSGKKLIERLPDKQRQAGSFMEQVLKELGRRPSFLNSEGIALYGQTPAEQTFGFALELCTTWINRILFLKLLEAQLISWHNEPEKAFLNIETITDFHDLSDLFFQVLNLPEDQRSATELKASLLRLPYLNSSLFERSDLEMVVDLQLLREGNFTNVWGQSILAKDGGTVKLMPKGPLEYLFRFLNAFDFGADTEAEGLKKESRTLINAPVLGLIFEKINGYKDGSFYTPSFVTMYMCRESIRRAIVQKVNHTGKVYSANYDDLRSQIRRKPPEERKELAKAVERITICDPAAGSGHFLVSALNETIFALSDLYLLFDDNGKELGEDGESIIVAENDELIVTDRFNKLVRYEVKEEANGILIPSQKAAAIQRGLFQIKRRLIENSLFGVDINPNSVQICRLRLWIELLKSAYYNDSPESLRFGKLETLPNLELNVQIGNSLISKFKTTVKLSEALKDTKGPDGKPLTTKNYRENVRKFRKATDKEHKERLKESIDASRNLYKEIQHRDVIVERSKKEGNVEALKNLIADGAELFEMDAKERKIRTKQLKDAEKELADFIEQTEETEKGRAFVKAFEWRYEIPEILDDAGNFIGFDVVVANPPYMRIQEIKKTRIT